MMKREDIARTAVGGGIIIGILWWLIKTLRGEEVPPPEAEVTSFSIKKE